MDQMKKVLPNETRLSRPGRPFQKLDIGRAECRPREKKFQELEMHFSIFFFNLNACFIQIDAIVTNFWQLP
jgi:hypothetical protein